MYGPFNTVERRFLAGAHGNRFPAVPADCPEAMRAAILEKRAQLLGDEFVEFRTSHHALLDEIRSAIASGATPDITPLF